MVKEKFFYYKIFSDEKIFTADAVLNRINSKYIAELKADIKRTLKTKHPAQVVYKRFEKVFKATNT